MLANPASLWCIDTYFNALNGDGYGTKMSAPSQNVTLAESQSYVFNPTNPGSAFDDGVEHRLHVRRRATDNAEHFGGGRLVLQGLPQFGIALLDLLEQSYVLDRDHRLVGEGLEKGDLLFRERTNLFTANYNCPYRNALAKQRSGKERPSTGALRKRCKFRELLLDLACDVMNVQRLPVNYRSAGWSVSINGYVFLRQQN